jgi:photosystem II stability/assembly factor-like uncharacterized protein
VLSVIFHALTMANTSLFLLEVTSTRLGNPVRKLGYSISANSKRLQNMGFGKDGRLWVLARGGQLQFSSPEDPEAWEEPQKPEFSTSWGLLDLAYRTPEEIWVTGGSGNLLVSLDGGKTWQKDRGIEDVPSNLYKIVFVTPEQGFIIGQKGVLLKYEQPPQAA